MTLSLTAKSGIQPELRRHFTQLGAVAIPLVAAAPVNAVGADRDIDAGVIALLNDGDTVTVTYPGRTPVVLTFDALAVPADGEFSDAVELADLIDAVDGIDAIENAGDVEMDATVPGAFSNGISILVDYLADTTAGGAVATAAAATIAAADIAELEVGDTIAFDGQVYTRAAATSVPDREFVNTAGLAACIDAEADWDAVVAVADVDITASVNGAAWNGRTVVITYNRSLTGGVDGTPAVAGAITIFGGRIYISSESAGPENDSWLRSNDLTIVTY